MSPLAYVEFWGFFSLLFFIVVRAQHEIYPPNKFLSVPCTFVKSMQCYTEDLQNVSSHMTKNLYQ